ncbi:MAG: hypothetical protein QXS38_00825 [Candidatus Pacearchaeota archaeon]
MQSALKNKQSYEETNSIARSPTLQTVLMVEKFVDENSGAYKKTELFNKLPRKVMWQTFQVIMEYLESIGKIAYDNEGYVVYIWNPAFVEKYRNRPAIKL